MKRKALQKRLKYREKIYRLKRELAAAKIETCCAYAEIREFLDRNAPALRGAWECFLQAGEVK